MAPGTASPGIAHSNIEKYSALKGSVFAPRPHGSTLAYMVVNVHYMGCGIGYLYSSFLKTKLTSISMLGHAALTRLACFMK